MKLAKFDTQPLPHFLMESATVDYAHADIRKLAAAVSSDDSTATARHCFEWVRDHIRAACLIPQRLQTHFIPTSLYAQSRTWTHNWRYL